MDSDASLKLQSPKIINLDHSDSLARNEVCKTDAPDNSSNETERLEQAPGHAVENMECDNLNQQDGELNSNSEGGVQISNGYAQHNIFSDKPSLDNLLDCSTAADESIGNGLKKDNTVENEHHVLQDVQKTAPLKENYLLNYSNSTTAEEPIAYGRDVVHSSVTITGIKPLCSTNTNNPTNNLTLEDTGTLADNGSSIPDHHAGQVKNSSVNSTLASVESGVECLYYCCSDCILALQSLIQKILAHEWRSRGGNWTVEDIHDVVESLSVNLLVALGKNNVSGKHGISIDDNANDEYPGNLPVSPEQKTCNCKRSENGLAVLAECCCHLGGHSESNIPTSEVGLNPRLVFREGVLVSVGSGEDRSFHCKFERLCLCSLIELVARSKHPID